MPSKKRKQPSRPRVLVMGGGLQGQLAAAGAEAVSIGYSDGRAAEAASHENIHALVLTGGSDVSPKLYGAKPNKHTQAPYPQRDEAEVRAVHEAFKRGIPIFGICRGSQLINVAFGGTLIQHIPSAGAHRWHLGHDHRVDLLKGTKILKAMKDLQPWVVSIHHQAVDKVAPGFVVGARSRDGIIEAIESHPKSGLPWIVATQFHPEIQTSRDEQSLFTEFVREAARVADLPEPKPFELPKAKPWVPAAKWNGTTTKWNTVVPGGKITPATSAIVVHQERIIDDPGKAIERWFCFRCGIEFDVRADQVDHMYLMHDVDLVPLMTSTQFDRYVDEITDDAEYQALEERWLNSRV